MSRFIAILGDDRNLVLDIARKLSSRIEQVSQEGLLVEIPEGWEKPARRHLQAFRKRLRIGVASNRTVALLAARGKPGSVVPAGREREFLAPLPLSLLEEGPSDSLSAVFNRWGITRLGELARLPKAALAARLGQAGLHRWRMAHGEDVQVFQPWQEELLFEESRDLDWELDSLDPLTFILSDMLERLLVRLQSRGLAAEEVHLRLVGRDGNRCDRTLRPAFPLRNPRPILTLLRLQLQTHPPTGAVRSVSLSLTATSARTLQHSLIRPPAPGPENLSRTLARLKAVVGDENVGSPLPRHTHRPDAFRMSPLPSLNPSAPGSQISPPPSVPVVLRRLRPPLPVRLDNERIVACAGPWRSSGEWWEGEDNSWFREEWDIERTDGSLCRIYWDSERQSWFLEGFYD